MRSDVAVPQRSGLWKGCILGIAILVNLTLLFRLSVGPQSLIAYRQLKAREADLLRQIEAMDEINMELSREIRMLHTDGIAMELAIRQRLNFLREDEVLYLFDDVKNVGSRRP